MATTCMLLQSIEILKPSSSYVLCCCCLQVGYVVQVSGGLLGEEVLEELGDYRTAFQGGPEDGFAVYYHCTR